MTRLNQRIRRVVCLACLAAAAGCELTSPVEQVPADLLGDTLSAAELRDAMLTEPPAHWGDGTARGDTLAHVAWHSYWLVEGGDSIDLQVGDRMLRFLHRRRYNRSGFALTDMQAIIIAYSPEPKAWLALAEAALAADSSSVWGHAIRDAAKRGIERKLAQDSGALQ